jgi:hypothetical protein
MPELKLKDIRKDLRLPELRLPEMSRDDIAKALGEARKELREVRKDIEEFRREFEMPRVNVTAVEMPQVDIDKVADGAKQASKQVADGAKKGAKQVAKGARGAAESAGLVKPANRLSRAPFILAGLVTIAMVGWALINSPSVKTRLRESAQRARERMAERRTAWDLDDDTRAFDAAKTAGVKPSAYSDALEMSNSPFTEPPAPLPERLGSDGQTHSIEQDTPARA